MAYNVQPLESFRLGAYQLPLPCYICGSGNLFDSQWCRNCYAPMEIMRIAAGSKTRPQLVATLGAGHVGKTVYLGMLLDILARQNEDLEFTTCDAASVAMQQESIAVLAKGQFPPATYPEPENWKWAHCRMKRRTTKVATEIFLSDMCGSTLLAELDQPNRYPVIGGLIRKATGVQLVIDAARVSQGDKDEEFFALKILGHVQDVLEREQASADKKQSDGKRRKKRRTCTLRSAIPPLAIILMKADQCPSIFDEPAEYARGQLSNLWQYCQERFPNHRYFASSAVGACAALPVHRSIEQVPLRVEPRGIMLPFRWLFSQFTPC